MLFKDELAAQLQYMERYKLLLQRKLTQMPEGRLVSKTARGKKYFYADVNGVLHSLRKKSEQVALFRQKAQIQVQIRNLEQNLCLLRDTADAYTPVEAAAYSTDRIQGKTWDETEALQNSFKSDHRELLFRGTYYKSKSEMLIASILTSYNIEFKYEVTIRHGYRKLYPDFVIKRPKDGKIFYWEHAGLTKREDYVLDLHARLDDFHAEGINLWDNLILSFDRPDGSVDVDYIDKIIRLYLL